MENPSDKELAGSILVEAFAVLELNPMSHRDESSTCLIFTRSLSLLSAYHSGGAT